MKTRKDPRHLRRQKIVAQLFASSFTPQEAVLEKVEKILEQKESIDKKIAAAAPTWPVDKLNKIDLAVLRQAIYELTNSKTPPKVVIDEAVELAKEYGSENSSSFINGVLGTIYKNLKPEGEQDKPEQSEQKETRKKDSEEKPKSKKT